MKEIKGLTGVRGYAALWVFFLHATWSWPVTSYAMKVARLGGSGVTIFFVLSGFILAHVYAPKFASSDVNYWAFMRARLARVYPLHIVTLLLFTALMALGLIGWPPIDNLYTFVLNVGLIQSWGFTDPITWNGPSWSISTEFFAYLLFPFYAAWLYRTSFWQLLAAIALVAYSIKTAPYGFFVFWAQKHGLIGTQGHVFAHGNSVMMWLGVFAAGCVLFSASEKLKRLRLPTWIYDATTFSGVALILYLCTWETGDLQLWQAAISASLIVFGLSHDAGLAKLVFGNRISHFLGKISYSLYLSAIMVEYTFMHWIHPLHLWENLALSISAATILHYLVEVPARRFLGEKQKKNIYVGDVLRAE
jgi:peptidoglycan/LPS O-acetylase OafA/YrhL